MTTLLIGLGVGLLLGIVGSDLLMEHSRRYWRREWDRENALLLRRYREREEATHE